MKIEPGFNVVLNYTQNNTGSGTINVYNNENIIINNIHENLDEYLEINMKFLKDIIHYF